MAGRFHPIFRRKSKTALEVPTAARPLMRVLEPRILLDAASVETALDIAGQASHSQLADDYAQTGQDGEGHTSPDVDKTGSDSDSFAEFDGTEARRTDREIVFIDSTVPDRDALIASLEPDAVIHILHDDSDGVQQIADILADSGGFDAIHIFSHGASGSITLGDVQLTTQSMTNEHASALAAIGEALSDDADILIYGCNFGEGASGREAALALSDATGADVAASDDLTGADALNGDWDLEVHVGAVERTAYSLPDWQNILPDFEMSAVSDPVITHVNNGIVGTPGTVATWTAAVTRDPGGGGPIETYDVRATVLAVTGDATASFDTVSTTDPTLDDFRVIVTNVGEVETNIGGQDVLAVGTVTVSWDIVVSGTEDPAPLDVINLVISDIDGLAGQTESREAVRVDPVNLSSYTTETVTNLVSAFEEEELEFDGTQSGTNDPASQVGFNWDSANQFVLTYETRTQTSVFDMDGDGDVTFTNPVVIETQTIDLEGSDTGAPYEAIYVNGSIFGSDDDVPVSIASQDLSIFDLNDSELESATIVLTNAQPGDQLNVDIDVLDDLGITATVTDNGTDIEVFLDGYALLANFETAIQSVTYSNSNADASFDRTTTRIITVEITDGIVTTSGATTQITFVDVTAANDPAVTARDTYVGDEDTPIVTSAGTGLLANDSDPEGGIIGIVGAFNSLGAPILLNTPTALPSGSLITLAANGSFTYLPAPHYSGTETIAYVVSDTTQNTIGYATFNTLPVVDPVSLNVVQPTPVSNEDAASAPISIASTSPDPSETRTVEATNIPDGVVITDGTNQFQAFGFDNFVDITDWNLAQISVLPPQNSDTDINITFVTINEEIDGSVSFDSSTVTFEIDAVADEPTVIVLDAGGMIDADVDLSNVISVSLFDSDGSEAITEVVISSIPVGGQMLVSGVPQTILGGAVSLTVADLPFLTFRPPQTGANAVYNMEVAATSTEVASENGVAQATATRSSVGLLVDLNNDNDPVLAANDFATTSTGDQVTINVLDNDYAPDGGAFVTLIDGQSISQATPVTLAGGQGEVSINPFGELVFTASSSFSGIVRFAYTVEDIDGSEDTALVTVDVLPSWRVTSDPSVEEGDDARFYVTLDGSLQQGVTSSVSLVLEDVTTDFTDYEAFVDAVNDSITNLGQDDFSFDGTTLTYVGPDSGYSPTYTTGSNAFVDISGSGQQITLGDDGLIQRNIGFSFPFYGDTFTNLYVSADGYVTFGTPTAEPDNFQLDGTAFGGRPAIAGYWDALNEGSGSIYVETVGDTPGTRQFIIQWDGVGSENDPTGNVTFQIVLNEADGSVQINYDDVDLVGVADQGGSASIGLENRNGSADSFSFNSAGVVENGSSILFTRGAVINPTLTIELPTVDDPNFETSEEMRLRLADASGGAIGGLQASVTINVSDNTPPVAVDDNLDVLETGTASINLISNVAGQDSDLEGHALTLVEINGQPFTNGDTIPIGAGGILTVNATGVVSFNPSGQYAALPLGGSASETFTYTISDGFGGTATATATVTVQGENETPVFDLDDDGTSATPNNAIIVQQTDGAVAVASSTASLIDVDDTTFVDMTIRMSGLEEPGFEIFTLAGQDFIYGTALTQPVAIGGTTFNVSYDGDRLFLITNNAVVEMPRADLEALVRSITYENTSASNEPGIRTMTFEVSDGDDIGTSGTVDITVTGPNTAPVAGDDGLVTPFTTVEDTMVTIPGATLLANDFDPDGDPISIAFVTPGAGGTPVLNGDGDVEFTPGPDFVGTAFFTYTIADGLGSFATASVYVDVSGVNDAPRVDLNGAGAGFDHTIIYTENDGPVAVLDPAGSVFDVDSATLTEMTLVLANGEVGDMFDLPTVPSGMTVSVVPTEATTGLTAPGVVTVTVSGTAPIADYQTALQAVRFENPLDNPVETNRIITVTANDGALTSTGSTTSISVVGVNDDPIAVADTASVDEDGSIVLSDTLLLSNDLDGDGDTLTLVSVQGALNGTVVLNGNNDAVFTPDPEYFGPASFSYAVNDGQGGMSIGIVTLTVNSVNDLPVIDLDTNTGGADFAAAYVEDAAAVAVVDPSVLITDTDSSVFEGAVVSLSNGQIGDVLRVGPLPAGISVFPAVPTALTDAGPLTLSFTGTATAAEYELALQAVTFETESDIPPTVVRTVEISVDDGFDMSNTATTLISVTPTNDAPVAVDDAAVPAAEDSVRVISPAEILGNDFDPDGDPIVLLSVSNPINGSVVLNGDGTVSFTPNPDYFGPASFDYTIEDPSSEVSTATANLVVASVNDLAVVDLDTVSGGAGFGTSYTENGVGVPLVGATSILDIDDVDMEQVTFTLTNGSAGDLLEVGPLPTGITATVLPSAPLAGAGTVVVTLTGTASIADYQAAMAAVTYRSVSDNPSTVQRSISVVVNDGDDDANTAITIVDVIAVNDDPVLAADGPFSTNEDEALILAPAALLFNDTDAEGDTLSLVSVQGAVNGTAIINGLGNVVFTPNTNYFGPAEFTYTVTDGNGGSSTQTATIDVVSINDAPQIDLDSSAGGSSFITAYTEGATGTALADPSVVLFDVEGGTLEGATLVLDNGQTGDVLEVGSLPTGISHTIVPSGALISSGTVTVELTGTASIADYQLALQQVIYRSVSDNPSTDPRTVSVTVSDGADDSAVAQTTILVSGVNDAPVAVDDGPFTITEDQPFTFSPAGLLFNDTDPEDDLRTVVSVQGAVNGTVVLNGNGTITFTPDADYSGPASFTYTIEDPSGADSTATVNLIVDPVNDAPLVDLDTADGGTGFSTVYNEGDAPIALADATVTLSDVDGTNISSATITLTNGQIGDRLTVGSLPAGITAALAPSGPLVVPGTASVTLTGSASFADYELALQAVSFDSLSTNPSATTRMVSVVVSDGAASSAPAITDITFNTVNDAPVAVDDGPFTLDEDTPFARGQATFIFNDTDGEGDPLTITSVQAAVNGTVALNAGIVTFTPDPDYSGPASFTYTVDDGNGGSNTGTVTLTVTAINDAPLLDLDAVAGGTGYSDTYVENGVGVAIVDGSVTISDVDDLTLFGASVTLTNGAVGDVLSSGALPGGITAFVTPAMPLSVPGSATLTLSGAASLADYQTALQAITYASTSDNPDTSDRMISIAVNDGATNSAAAMSLISVTATNDAPVSAADGPFTVDEDATLSLPVGSLLFNDIDAEGETLTVTSVQSAVNGVVGLNAGVVTFTPDPDYSGPASFTYTVEDTNGASSTSTVTVDVVAVNDAPDLDLDSTALGSGTTVAYVENDAATGLVGSDVSLSDVDDTLIESATITLTNGQVGDMLEVGLLPPGLSLLVSPSGPLVVPGVMTVTLTGALPAADYETALQAITYRSTSDNINSTNRIVSVTVNDGDTDSAAATVTVSVTAVNDAPTPSDDGVFDTDEDTPLSLPAGALLINDSDPEGEPLTLVSVQSAVNGSVVLTGGNVALFTPDANYSGPASFTYTVEDASGAQTVATVSINVVSINDLPVTDLNTGTGGSGHTLNYVENDGPAAIVDATVTLTDADDTLLESASVVLSNGFVGDVLAVGALPSGLSATVLPSGPLAVDGAITVTISGTGTLADYQSALQAVTYQSLSDNPDPAVRSLSLTVFDGDDSSVAAATAISITVVNDAPTGVADGPFSVDEDTDFTVQASTLLFNDSDPEADALTVISVQAGVNGTVSMNGAGLITFVPDAHYNGPASFDYTVRDANGATSDATVSLDIISINDVPTVDLNGGVGGTSFDVTFVENGAGVTIVSPDVTLSDDDDTALVSAQVVLTNGNDGDVLDVAALPAGITALVSPSGGLSGPGTITVTLSGTGILADYETALQAITYRSTSDNPDTTQRLIEVTVNDGEDASVIALSRVTVTAVNDAPIAADDGTPAPLAVLEDTPFVFDPVTSNDIDLEGDVLTITAIDGTTITAGGFVTLASGRVDLDPDGVTLTFNPTPNSFGPVSFTYTVSDGALSDMATINIDVVSVNDAPIAVDDGPVVLLEDDVAYFDPVLANDSDVEGQALSIVAIDGQPISAGVSVFVTNGQITLGVDNRTLEFVPDPDYFGQTTITYSVSDGIDQSDATVTFDVTGVDDVIVNTGAPANQTFEDGQIVSLGMAAFFADPDNDPILYSGSGLPGGLTIDSGTGLISGQLDSDASLGGTYTVLVEANDGNNPTVSTTFDITVTNTVPVAGGNIVTSVTDGDAVFIDTSAQFVDADGDTLTYSTTALPTWLTFDSGTGILSGVAPADASVSGPIAIIVTADDGEGGSDQFSLTLTPQNAVPVVLGSAPDLLVRDGDVVTFDVAAHFADGVPDNDALTFSVTGLPAGVTFDALTGQISGVVSSQSGGSGSFTVVMTADDGQGGVVSDGFTITVGGDDAVEAPNLFANFLDLVDDDDTGSKEESGQTGLTVSVAAEISGGTVTLEEGEDVVQAVVNSIEPLRSGTDELDGFIDATGFGVRDGEGQFLFPDGTSLLDFDNGSFLDVEPGSTMLDAVTVSATARSGLLLIELNDRAGDTMTVAQVRLAVSGMEQWPSWMTMVRDKLVSVRPPVGLETLDLTMAIVFEDGQSVLKMVRVNVETGAIENVEQPAKDSEDVTSPPDEAAPDLASNQDGKTVAENAGQVEGLRASLTD